MEGSEVGAERDLGCALYYLGRIGFDAGQEGGAEGAVFALGINVS